MITRHLHNYNNLIIQIIIIIIRVIIVVVVIIIIIILLKNMLIPNIPIDFQHRSKYEKIYE